MVIDDLMISEGPSSYYTEAFRNVLEDHLSFLKVHARTRVISIDPNLAYKYEFDLFGLLSAQGIPTQLHWLVMRLNDMASPTEVRRDLAYLLIPDATVIQQLQQSHATVRGL